jgi:hypothetical protein
MNKVIYIEKNDISATLCCWLYCAHFLLWRVQKEGYDGYIHWPNHPNLSLFGHRDPAKFAEVPNQYDWWFKQPMFPDSDSHNPPSRDVTWLWECGWPGGEGLMNQPFSVIKAWYQKYVIIRPEIVARADALLAKYNADPANLIGLSWRGCEAAFDPDRGPLSNNGGGQEHMQESIENYFPHIDAILEKEPNLRIFATAEEDQVAEKVVARYPNNAFMMSEFFKAPRGYGSVGAPQQSGWINPASGYERGVQTCMLISILSRCKHYIKNRSNMSCTASYLSNNHIVYINHPEVCV